MVFGSKRDFSFDKGPLFVVLWGTLGIRVPAVKAAAEHRIGVGLPSEPVAVMAEGPLYMPLARLRREGKGAPSDA